ncbi:MAG: hypothetical protein EPN22_02165 [Nitrospirae bacterium]|nr:MAG: hypothetical protein EPN22_02165 [Nitrospirota bacterium]
MKGTRYILRNLTTLNIVLFAVLLLALKYLVMPLLTSEIKFKPVSPKKTKVELNAAVPDNKTLSPIDYALIAEQNLFHPERKIPIETKDEKQAPKPEFVLYGILATEDTTIAYVEDKRASSASTARGKRQQALKRGDTLSGFKLETIDEDRVVMSRGDDKITVFIAEKQRQKAKTATGPAGTEQPGMPRSTQLPQPMPQVPQRQPIVVQPKK